MDAGVVAISNNENLKKIFDALDEKSRILLWYLWWNRHADISKLREITDSSNDFEVLNRLEKVINKKSQQLWHRDIVKFEQSRMDPINGENIIFNWWLLTDEDFSISDNDKPLVDIFNEKENVIVIAQIPDSLDISKPELSYKNGILKVKLKKIKTKPLKMSHPQKNINQKQHSTPKIKSE